MKKTFRKRISNLLKGIWHIIALVLLLSLPTFSFFMPGFEISDLVDLAVKGGYSFGPAGAGEASGPAASGDSGMSSVQAAGFTRSGSGTAQNNVLASRPAGSARGRSDESGSLGDRRGIISREGLSGSGRNDGERASQDNPNAGSSDLLASVLKDLERLDEAVKTLTSGYGSQTYSGSESNRYLNPFLRSLANNSDGGDSGGDGDGGDSGGGDSGGGDSGGGDSGGGDNGGGDSGGGSSGDDTQNTDPDLRVYDALLIGSFRSGQECPLIKASCTETNLKYYLDDGSSIDLFYSSGGAAPGVIVQYSLGELVLTSDYNNDSRDDLLVVSRGEFGDTVTCWARVMDNQIQEAFSGSFPYRTVSGLDFFDWDSDGVKELVVAFENTSNLFIYDINNKTLRYSREFSLPFEPSVLISTATLSPFKNSYLHVGNDSLDQNVLFNSRYPGVYSFMTPSTLKSAVEIALDNPDPGEEPSTFIGVEYADRLIVLRKQNDYYNAVCSTGLRYSHPIAAITGVNGGGFLKINLGF